MSNACLESPLEAAGPKRSAPHAVRMPGQEAQSNPQRPTLDPIHRQLAPAAVGAQRVVDRGQRQRQRPVSCATEGLPGM